MHYGIIDGMRWQRLQKIVFAVFMVLIVISLLIYEIIGDGLNSEQVRQYLKGFGVLAPFVFIAFYAAGAIFIPSTPFMALAGILFGFKYGLLYTIVGGFLSSIIVFEISRKLGKEKVESVLEYKYLRYLGEYNKKLEEGAVWDLIILRNTPIMPFNVLNILMGVSKIKTADYIIGTALGLIPTNVLTVYIGAFITKIF